MAFEGYKNLLAGKLQGAQLENQLASRAAAAKQAGQLAGLNTQLKQLEIQKLQGELGGAGKGDDQFIMDVMAVDQPARETLSDIQQYASEYGVKPERLEPYIKQLEPRIKTEEKVFTQEAKLRDKYVAQSADFSKQRDAYGRIEASAKDPSPAGDLALIFNFMKVLDPGSVVRESEFENAASAKASLEMAKESGERVPNFVMGAVNRMLTGQRLLENQRNDFVNRAGRLYKSAASQHGKRSSQYSKLARGYGLDPKRVVMDLDYAGGQQKAPAPVAKPPSEMSDAELKASLGL
jgi:hypothetical protein